MEEQTIVINYNKSQLLTVPSVHFHHIFALEVRKIFADPDLKPDCVAVELGPFTAEEAKRWLVELTGGNGCSNKLPLMLGLLKPNRMIHPAYRMRANELQKENGMDLSELAPETLYQELGYASNCLLCLSPTDSIIEAMRCSIETELPLYGVDLEDMADGKKIDKVMIQDPISINNNFSSYIEQNAEYAAGERDPEIDIRRETAMAARLKTLLNGYRRVLFICGMAHWTYIRKFIEDNSIKAAEISCDNHKRRDFQRLVVHPQKAIKYTGLYPVLANMYEENRRPANEIQGASDSTVSINASDIFNNFLQKTYDDYFFGSEAVTGSESKQLDLQCLGEFESYLSNLCLLNLATMPDIYILALAANKMMSRSFYKAVVKTFTDVPWARHEEFPQCMLIAPSLKSDDNAACVIYDRDGYVRDACYLSESSQDRQGMTIEVPYEITYQGKMEISNLHTWVPWDNLISAMSIDSADQAERIRYKKRIETFEGSLIDGIDIKSTLRSYAKGHDQIYVIDRFKKKSKLPSGNNDFFPVVWILQPGDHVDSNFTALYEDCTWMNRYIKDKQQFNAVKQKRGNKMIALVGYGNLHAENEITKKKPDIRCDKYYGILLFQPICWERKQFAGWIESTEYQRNPFCNDNSLSSWLPGDLTHIYKNEHDIKIENYRWETALILMAVPFAKGAFTVAVTDSYQIESAVYEKAELYGVEIHISSVSNFPPEKLERISMNYMIPTDNYDPKCKYKQVYEEAMGEKSNEYEELVPPYWFNYGMED